jgi:protein O-mannosyl-transferase
LKSNKQQRQDHHAAGMSPLAKSRRRDSEMPGEIPANQIGPTILGVRLSLRLCDWLLALLLLVATFVAYMPVWHGGFIWDDAAHITRPGLRSLSGLAHIWTRLGATQQYYPLVHTLFWVEYRLWGDSTTGYHFVNILLHACSALLLVKILRLLKIPGEWLAAVIFALHPIQVESVAWISELKNTMSGLFYLSSTLVYLEFDRDRSRKKYALALGLFLLGLMSKSVIATLPATLLVIFWWQRGKLSWKLDCLPLVPFFATGIGTGLFTSWVERKFIGAEGSAFNFSIIERFLIAGRAVCFYLAKLCWPAQLTFNYPRWHIDETVWWQYLFPLGVLALGLALWNLRSFSRGPLAAFLFFVIALLPALGFLNVYPFIYSFVADHFQYLACLGPVVLVAAAMGRAIRPMKEKSAYIELASCVIFILILGTLTWQQSRMYINLETLWKTTLTRNPLSFLALNDLGAMDCASGQIETARLELEESIKLNPFYSPAHINFGLLLESQGQLDLAYSEYQKAVELAPISSQAHFNLGMLLERKQQFDGAIKEMSKGLRLDPDSPDAHNELGILWGDKGNWDEAINQFQQALTLKPDFAIAQRNLDLTWGMKTNSSAVQNIQTKP